MAKRGQLDPEASAPVSEEELAAIARHLRSVLGGPEPEPFAAPHAGSDPAALRFVAFFVAPCLLLVVLMLAGQTLV